jgi:hypothetical protein
VSKISRRAQVAIGWTGALILFVLPLAVLVALSQGVSLEQAIGLPVAAALPAVYFGLTMSQPAGTGRAQTWLTALSKFTACLAVAGALSVLVVVGALGLIVIVAGLGVAGFIAVGTALLRHGQLLGALPMVLVNLASGVLFLRQEFSLPADVVIVRVLGALAFALAAATLILAGRAWHENRLARGQVGLTG